MHVYTGESGREERERGGERERESERASERGTERARAREGWMEGGRERERRVSLPFAHTGGSRQKDGRRLRVLDVARACSIGANLAHSHSFTHTHTHTHTHTLARAHTCTYVRAAGHP